MIITVERLKKLQACKDQVVFFQSEFGKKVKVTRELCIKYRAQFDWDWAARNLLSGPAREAYMKAKATAREAYMKAKATAWEAYEKVEAPAWEAYMKAKATAWEAFEKAKAPAWEAFEKAKAAAFAEAAMGRGK